jgi:hypothetical protein
LTNAKLFRNALQVADAGHFKYILVENYEVGYHLPDLTACEN